MADEINSGPGGEAPAPAAAPADAAKPKSPPPPKLVPSQFGQVGYDGTSRVLPERISIQFLRGVRFGDELHELTVGSVNVWLQLGSGAPSGQRDLRLSDGAILRAPAADLGAAAGKLAGCTTMAQVAEVFAEIVLAGTKA